MLEVMAEAPWRVHFDPKLQLAKQDRVEPTRDLSARPWEPVGPRQVDLSFPFRESRWGQTSGSNRPLKRMRTGRIVCLLFQKLLVSRDVCLHQATLGHAFVPGVLEPVILFASDCLLRLAKSGGQFPGVGRGDFMVQLA